MGRCPLLPSSLLQSHAHIVPGTDEQLFFLLPLASTLLKVHLQVSDADVPLPELRPQGVKFWGCPSGWPLFGFQGLYDRARFVHVAAVPLFHGPQVRVLLLQAVLQLLDTPGCAAVSGGLQLLDILSLPLQLQICLMQLLQMLLQLPLQ